MIYNHKNYQNVECEKLRKRTILIRKNNYQHVRLVSLYLKKETRIIKKTINILQNNQSCEPATVKDNQVRSSNTDEIRVLQEQLSKFEHSVTTKLEMHTMEMQHKLQIQEMNMRHQLKINHLRN